jgi:hypothetical protein
MVNIKKYIFICLMLFSCVVYAENKYFENKHTERREKPTRYYPKGQYYIDSITYKFKLIKKINESSGYFRIITDRYMAITSSSPINNTYESEKLIVIYYNLKNMVDGDFIKLKNKQRLYAIGSMTNNKGFTFRVYSFNKKAVVDNNKLTNNKKAVADNNKLTNNKTPCKYCNGTGYITKKSTPRL